MKANTPLTDPIEQPKKSASLMGLPTPLPMYRHLVVVHYHLRPGGVRRIIELALPHIAQASPHSLAAIVLATGEKPENDWRETLTRSLPGRPVRFFYEPAFRYLSEQRSSSEVIRAKVRSALEKLAKAFAPAETLFWAQNLALARNLILSDELAKFSARHGLALLSHHHDLWFENRWARWSEMRTCGFRSLAAVARASFAAKARVCHVTINKLDYAVLSKHLNSQAKCLPNLSERAGQPPRGRVRAARDWLKSHLGDDCPVWIFPTRFLRRKNLAEAVLLARWLRPDAWFVTTAGVSSREERHYARRLESMALREKWKARFRILDSNNSAPPIGDIVMASEVMLLTSAQEGFGLPYLEAAAFEKPLIARHLPNVVPDLLELGFSFPHLYDEILIAPDLLDLKSERTRQQRLWREWKAAMPSLCRRLAKRPVVLTLPPGEPVPFSRLTLTAQLEVLAIAPEQSWNACLPANPFLRDWRALGEAKRLEAMRWPQHADEEVGGRAYASRFWDAVANIPQRPVRARAVERAQHDSIAQRLKTNFLYPILFGEE
jgi:glycosyltransferase involved in cell wall biosynthesis